ncbi:putative TIM-barrel protein, nifR3 family [Ruminococcaceae bacterium YRB3002]|nr:putative TIM-barrel protein, nifR3 family [Ruminococcaceae bacterium YRB3002]
MLKPVKIGNMTIDVPICLAPMAGCSSVVYRRICHEFGSGYAPTELSSARSVRFSGIDKGFRYMRIDPEGEGICGIQLFGNDPEDFDYAIRAISDDERLSKVSIFDINMGCPVPKVVKTGAGSALIRTPELAGEIVRAARTAAEACGKALTVKTRIGFDRPGEASELIRAVVDNGAQMVCIHGRTRTQMYSGKADWDQIARLGETVKSAGVPLFANGDIRDVESAGEIIEKTGCDGIMVGRAAMGDPWIFARLAGGLMGLEYGVKEPADEQRVEMIMRHLREECGVIREEVAVKEARSIMPQYIKGMRGAAAIRMKLVSCSTVQEVEDVLYGELLGGAGK